MTGSADGRIVNAGARAIVTQRSLAGLAAEAAPGLPACVAKVVTKPVRNREASAPEPVLA